MKPVQMKLECPEMISGSLPSSGLTVEQAITKYNLQNQLTGKFLELYKPVFEKSYAVIAGKPKAEIVQQLGMGREEQNIVATADIIKTASLEN